MQLMYSEKKTVLKNQLNLLFYEILFYGTNEIMMTIGISHVLQYF